MALIGLLFLFQTINCQLDWEVDIPNWEQEWEIRNHISLTSSTLIKTTTATKIVSSYQPKPKVTIQPTNSQKLLRILTNQPDPKQSYRPTPRPKLPNISLIRDDRILPYGSTHKPILSSVRHNYTRALKRFRTSSIVSPTRHTERSIPCNYIFSTSF